ncbi:MAG TPA: Cu(I)-responsive transcriptional regulator [Steroidobacteraceae bacterium]|nr:Cu(I)-responsive transcriptional regulator [Steroidobacteraceae bacterium]
MRRAESLPRSPRSDATMRIGEAASRSGVSCKTIRFYEQAGLIAPASRLANRYRGYRHSDVQTLRFIQRARRLGFSLKDIARLLVLYRNRHRASKDVKRLALARVAEIERKIAELTAVRNTIAELARRCRGDERPECPILEELETTTEQI